MYDPAFYRGGNDLYAQLQTFTQTYGKVTYPQFDSHILNSLNLFDVPDEAYLHQIEYLADRIIAALPAFKRILARPIIRLKDAREIVPIEAVRIINNQSLSHVSTHSEFWENVVDGCVRPRKLMTIEYAETYEIYENIVFAYAIDTILSFIRHALTRLRDTLYGCSDLHFNLLDRTHHNLYFLAIGKLHLEYSRAHASHTDLARCMEKLLFIDKTLRAKLSAPVYRKCKGKKSKITLKKTNIFRSHKDYEEIFHVLKLFDTEHEDEKDNISANTVKNGYSSFCLLLTIFAIGHFHFEFPTDQMFSLTQTDTEALYKDWHLHLQAINHEGIDALVLTVQKDKIYTVCLILNEQENISSEQLQSLQIAVYANEYCFCSPNHYGEPGTIHLSIFDIDSFRRIQQVLLRCMIYTDRKFTHCAFCGQPMQKTDHGYECSSCRAELIRAVCPDTQKPYIISDIKRYTHISNMERENYEKRKFLHDRLDESKLHFRNITPISQDGKPVCPHCRRVHEILK